MEDSFYMAIALEEARVAFNEEEVPIGAVLIKDGKIIARDHNRREQNSDPTAHAEVLVLRTAGEILGSWRITDSTLYVTLEPCPMCAGALVQARVDRLVYGAPDPKAGAVKTLYQITEDSRLNHRLQVTGGIQEQECAAILKEFFTRRRK